MTVGEIAASKHAILAAILDGATAAAINREAARLPHPAAQGPVTPGPSPWDACVG